MAQRTITDCLGQWVVVERDDMEDGRIHQGAVIEIDHHSFTFSGFTKHLGLSPLNRCFDIDEIREDEDRVVMEGMYTVEDATLTRMSKSSPGGLRLAEDLRKRSKGASR